MLRQMFWSCTVIQHFQIEVINHIPVLLDQPLKFMDMHILLNCLLTLWKLLVANMPLLSLKDLY